MLFVSRRPETLFSATGASPSGANSQPWTYVVVSNPATKAEIRDIIEAEERINYERRMGDAWVKELRILKVGHKYMYRAGRYP